MVPAASHEVLVVTDASLRLEGGSRATGLQDGLSAGRALVESVAVSGIGPSSGTSGSIGSVDDGSGANRVEEHEGHEGGDHLVGELHCSGY